MTNICIYDCKYCLNRKSNNVKRAIFIPEEICTITINFYKRNYIEGLFLSSGIIKSPDYTMEKIIETITLLRKKYHFEHSYSTKEVYLSPKFTFHFDIFDASIMNGFETITKVGGYMILFSILFKFGEKLPTTFLLPLLEISNGFCRRKKKIFCR